MGSVPELGRSPGGALGNPLQYSCLENPMDREAWWGPWGHQEVDMTDTTQHACMRKSEEDMVVKLVLGYILCEISDINIRERDKGRKAWGKCGKKRGKYGKERKSFHRFNKQNM